MSMRLRKTLSGGSPGVSMTETMPCRQLSSLTRSRRNPPGTDSEPLVAIMTLFRASLSQTQPRRRQASATRAMAIMYAASRM